MWGRLYIYSEAIIWKAEGVDNFLEDFLDQLIKEKCASKWQILSLIETRESNIKFYSYKTHD